MVRSGRDGSRSLCRVAGVGRGGMCGGAMSCSAGQWDWAGDSRPAAESGSAGVAARKKTSAMRREFEIRALNSLTALSELVHVLDCRLVDEGPGTAAHFESMAVIPLDLAFEEFAVFEHDDHGRLRLNLLLQVKQLGLALRDVSVANVRREP